MSIVRQKKHSDGTSASTGVLSIALKQLTVSEVTLYTILVLLGVAGNCFNYPVFFDVNFLFGSIFALLALQYYGLLPGIIAGVVVASYTYVLWRHPYVWVILSAEVTVVGLTMRRRRLGLVLADTIFWLLLGAPMGYCFFNIIMHVPISNTYMLVSKLIVNGISNALIARVLYFLINFYFKKEDIFQREAISCATLIFIIAPSLAMMAVDSRDDFIETNQSIKSIVSQTESSAVMFLDIWVKNRKEAVTALADRVALDGPQRSQHFLEELTKGDSNFIRVGIVNKQGISVAFYPKVDELNQSNVDKNFSDRSFIPKLEKERQTMLSEIALGRIGIPSPRTLVVAPVVRNDQYEGFIAGVLSFDQCWQFLDFSTKHSNSYFTLLDSQSNIVITNRPNQKNMEPLSRGKGELKNIGNGLSQWIPVSPPNTATTERWKTSFYIKEAPIGSKSEWRLVVEQPVAPFQKKLYNKYAGHLMRLTVLVAVALLLAELFSRKTMSPLEKLCSITRDLPKKIEYDINTLGWPSSSLSSTSQLINNFRSMAASLAEKFNENRQMNATLEQQVAMRTVELLDSEARYKQVVNSMQESLAVLTERGVVLFANAKAAIDFSESNNVNAVVGKNIQDFFSKKSADFIIELCQRAIANNFSMENEFFASISSKERWLQVKLVPINYGKNKIASVLALFLDVTSRKNNEEELRQAKETSEAATLAKSNFLANMSHEIRTPINGVMGMLQLILTTKLDAEQAEYVQLAIQSCRRLTRLLGDILDLSRIEAGKLELIEEQFDIIDVLDAVKILFLPAANQTGIKFSFQIDPMIPKVLCGDGPRLQQILNNLVGNALKFTQSGSVKVEVSLLAIFRENERKLFFSISDTGIGMPLDRLKELFQPFTQAEKTFTKKYQGAGLGLSIVKHLVQLMNGNMCVESEEGFGSTFHVCIPFKVGSEGFKSKSVLIDNMPTFKAHRNVLVAEDDAMSAMILVKQLEKFGCAVCVVKDGEQAVDAVRTDDFDLVLMDIQMPVLDGVEATKRIRSGEAGLDKVNVPIIALTAYAMAGDKEKIMAAGMTAYLGKPVEMNSLMKAINDILKV